MQLRTLARRLLFFFFTSSQPHRTAPLWPRMSEISCRFDPSCLATKSCLIVYWTTRCMYLLDSCSHALAHCCGYVASKSAPVVNPGCIASLQVWLLNARAKILSHTYFASFTFHTLKGTCDAELSHRCLLLLRTLLEALLHTFKILSENGSSCHPVSYRVSTAT